MKSCQTNQTRHSWDVEFLSKSVDQESFLQCVKELSPKEPMESEYTLKSDDDWLAVSEQLKNVSLQLKELEEKEKAIKEKLIKLSDNQSSQGNGVKVTKYTKSGSVDYKSIPELKDVNLDKYKKESSECWRISIEKEL